MRLTRLEAVRFGRLDQVPLGPIGGGLTVVVGPNGAGKTSFTTLARYVLYGYPRKNDKAEPDYESSAGKRVGRLAFADATGEWLVERTEGVRGGQLSVRAMEGAERPKLVDEVTRGVSRNEFRVVFGFGLQDMADLEPEAGSSGVLSRLYAARVGLAVSPQDVRDDIDGRAAGLYKPRGSTPQINATAREMTQIKKRIRELEDAAGRYAADRERLAQMKSRLEVLRAERDATASRLAELDAQADRLEALEHSAMEHDAELVRLTSELERAREYHATIVVDDELLSSAPQIASLLEDVSGYKERLVTLTRLESRVAAARRSALEALDSAALDEARAGSVVVSPESRVGIERFRDEFARARARSEAAERSLEEAQARTDVTVAAQGPAPAGQAQPLPSLIMGVMGLLAIGVGLALSQMASVAVGAVLVIAAFALALVVRSRSAGAAPAPSPAVVSVELPLAEAERAREAFAATRAEWLAAAERWGLATTGEQLEPEAAALVLGAIEQWRRATAEERDAASEATALREQAQRFRDSLATLVGDRVPTLGSASLDEVPGLAARVRETLDAGYAVRDRRAESRARQEALADELARVEAEIAAGTRARADLLERLGLPDADSARLRALAEEARGAADEADEAHTLFAGEVGRLEGELDTEGKDRDMAELRLALAGLQERLGQAVERYVVLATASRLIGRTQAYYEQARQPEVVRRAGQVFSEITQGRYDRISIPSGGGEIVAFNETDPTPCSELSRGSQEQLYLALRIALVEQLDEVGEGLPVLMDDIFANFDPERHRGAAAAVAELARHRQVVFFTCHPQVADLFAAIDPGHTRLVLERC